MLKSSDFDEVKSVVHGSLNSQKKLFQSHESLDLDNHLTLHDQHVAILLGNCRVTVN